MSRDIIDVYDRSIFEMRNVFTPEECLLFIDYFEQNQNKKHGEILTPGGFEVNYKLKRTIDVVIGDINHKLFTLMIEKIKQVYREYVKHLNDINRECGLRLFSMSKFQSSRIQRTDKGGYFAWHSDYNIDPNENRLAGIIIYLNDIDEENGGSTEFNSGRKVQPEVGKVLVFPTSDIHLHRGCTLLNGPSKYIISSFILHDI